MTSSRCCRLAAANRFASSFPRTGLIVVVSPLIALMKDPVDALQAGGVPAAFLNSSLVKGSVAQ
jgi:superfamily II DNA helicase RecQ